MPPPAKGEHMGYILAQKKRPIALIFSMALASATLASCNGGTDSGAPPAMPGNLVPPAGSWQALFPQTLTPLANIDTYPGAVNGEDDLFKPKRGDYSTGGQGQLVDKKVPCLPHMSNDYHIHVFLGIVYNGKLIAVPHAVGMVNPGAQVDGWTNSADCFYEIHTHDSSGIVHVEVAQLIPLTSVYYHLRDIFDVWGVPYGKDFLGPFKGPVHIFVGNVPLRQLTVSSYLPYTKSISFLGLRSHEVIWYEIGKQYFGASQLPQVTFYMEY
jgi:hypothetical protein